MSKMQTIIWLARHGQTDRQFVLDSEVDAARSLDDLGKKQAQAIGRYLDNYSLSAIYSSPLKRCQQTAEEINCILEQEQKVIIDSALAELYEDYSRAKQGEAGGRLLETIVSSHLGDQALVITHQFLIDYIVQDFFDKNQFGHSAFCGELYRLTFADGRLVDISLLKPPLDEISG